MLQETGHNQTDRARDRAAVRGYYRRPAAVDEVIGLVGLQEAPTAGAALSGGNAAPGRRVALVGDPELCFWTSPHRVRPGRPPPAWEVIAGLRELGKTILLTTHYMEEAQALADRVAIIAAGRIVAEGTPDELAAAQHVTDIRFTLPAHAAPAELPRVSGRVATRGRNVEIATDDPTHDLLALLGWAAGRGAGRLDGLTVTRPSLEDIYLALTSDTEEAA